jgi:hypothetical protein
LTFFGLTSNLAPQTRAAIFTQIHEICFHGKGGYDWNTVYNMPIWLRKFTFSKIQDYYQQESEAIENTKSGKKGQKTLIDPSGRVNTPEFLKTSEQYKKPAKWK